jgi:hypothetical protein
MSISFKDKQLLRNASRIALVKTGSGFVWLLFGLAFVVGNPPWVVGLRFGVIGGMIVLFAVSRYNLSLTARALEKMKVTDEPPKDVRTAKRNKYIAINVGQFALIIALGMILYFLHYYDTVFPPVLASIVGAHFFPMARMYDNSVQLYITGAAIIVLDAAVILLLPFGRWGFPVLEGTGIIIWASVISDLVRTMSLRRNVLGSP